VEGGSSVLRILERIGGNVRSIHLGRVSVAWLLATVEALVQENEMKDFQRTSKLGSQPSLPSIALISTGVSWLWQSMVGTDIRVLLWCHKVEVERGGDLLTLSCTRFFKISIRYTVVSVDLRQMGFEAVAVCCMAWAHCCNF
jgi:hypothetical protein